jgi:hypothetical protein
LLPPSPEPDLSLDLIDELESDLLSPFGIDDRAELSLDPANNLDARARAPIIERPTPQGRYSMDQSLFGEDS